MSAIATIEYANSFAGINRIDQKRVITISSNVLGDANPNAVVTSIKDKLRDFSVPDGVTIKMTGEQEDQAETGAFLGVAAIVSSWINFYDSGYAI